MKKYILAMILIAFAAPSLTYALTITNNNTFPVIVKIDKIIGSTAGQWCYPANQSTSWLILDANGGRQTIPASQLSSCTSKVYMAYKSNTPLHREFFSASGVTNGQPFSKTASRCILSANSNATCS